MICPWSKRYQVAYAYTLSEIIQKGLASMSTPYTAGYPKANTTIFLRSLFTPYGIAFPANTLIPNKYIDAQHTDLLNMIIERFWDEYVFESKEEMGDPADILTYPDILYKTRTFLGRLINVIEFTYPKYAAILDSYDTAKTKLLDKLQKVIDQDTSNTGTSNHDLGSNDTRRDNDTPQDGGDFDDDEHTSFITQGDSTGHDNRTDNLASTNDVTESWEDTPIIERLDKIQRLYQATMLNWVNEFKPLFIEGGNIHEVK